MKRKIIVMNLCLMLFFVTLSNSIISAHSIHHDVMQEKTMILTLHTLHGIKKIPVTMTTEFLSTSDTPLSYEELLAYLSEDDREYINGIIQADKEQLVSQFQAKYQMINTFNHINTPFLKKILKIDEYFINYLCTVKGVGLLFLFPPFLPITPFLWAGLLLFNTNGTKGEINQAVDGALMVPFIGISIWAQTYFFAGFAGFAVGYTTDNSTAIRYKL